jgi:hypothetical protein
VHFPLICSNIWSIYLSVDITEILLKVALNAITVTLRVNLKLTNVKLTNVKLTNAKLTNDVTGHHLYSGTWNYRIVLASFHFSWESPVWSPPFTNKGTSWREQEHSWYPLMINSSRIIRNLGLFGSKMFDSSDIHVTWFNRYLVYTVEFNTIL